VYLRLQVLLPFFDSGSSIESGTSEVAENRFSGTTDSSVHFTPQKPIYQYRSFSILQTFNSLKAVPGATTSRSAVLIHVTSSERKSNMPRIVATGWSDTESQLRRLLAKPHFRACIYPVSFHVRNCCISVMAHALATS
jgi:hypothetical protein